MSSLAKGEEENQSRREDVGFKSRHKTRPSIIEALHV